MKLTNGIYRISDLGKRVDIKSNKSNKHKSMYLIGAMQNAD